MEDQSEVIAAETISSYELEDVGVLVVQNLARTDDLLYNGKPVKITVYSPGTPEGIRANHRAAMAATLRMKNMMSGKVDKNAAIQFDEERIAKVIAITASIENFPTTNPKALYSNPKLIDIALQVDEFFTDRSNFSKVSTKP
jgi:hypothetical protein